MEDVEDDAKTATKYYSLVKHYLKKQYSHLNEREMRDLCRMVIFADENDEVKIKDVPNAITEVRRTLANYIERNASTKSFIPYSINAEIANLIEQSNNDTVSMNEYYRWVHVVMDIVHHTGDGVVTHDDAAERRAFISMSYDREIELLLCLALYQGAEPKKQEEKINLLFFKLEKLRELRNIVFNTSRTIASQKRGGKDQLRQYYDYCQQLLQQNLRYISRFRLKLKLNRSDNSNDEDYEDDIFFLEHLRKVVLRMLRRRRRLFLREQRLASQAREFTPAELVMMSQGRDVN